LISNLIAKYAFIGISEHADREKCPFGGSFEKSANQMQGSELSSSERLLSTVHSMIRAAAPLSPNLQVRVQSVRKEVAMPVMQPPTGPIEITDPNNVPELFVNGPFNVINMGGMMQITFTTMRPNANDLFSGKDAPEFRGTVACRLLMPAGLAEQLVRTVADSLIKAAKSSGPTPPQNDPLSRDREDSRAAVRSPIRFE
jgi:hypothetical protein